MNSETKKVANTTLYLILLILSFLIPISGLGILFFSELDITIWHIIIGCIVGIVLATISKKAYKKLGSGANVLNGVVIGALIALFLLWG